MLDALPNISPISCFSVNFTIPFATDNFFNKKKYRELDCLPNTQIASDQEIFGDITIGWNPQGIYLIIQVHKPFENSFSLEANNGDGIEIFIDTRDQKSHSMTKFCHHFIFLPAAIDDVLSKEVTQFSVENTRKLADSQDFLNNVTFGKRGYRMEICIMESVLYGFNPIDIKTLGFTYLLHRKSGAPQYFSCSPKEFAIEKSPALWASGKLEQY